MDTFPIGVGLIVLLVVAVPFVIIALARGKLTRLGFAVRFVASTVLTFVLGLTWGMLTLDDEAARIPFANFYFWLADVVLGILIYWWTALRLNGMGWNRWWTLLYYLWPIGLVMAIVLCVKRGPIDSAVPLGESSVKKEDPVFSTPNLPSQSPVTHSRTPGPVRKVRLESGDEEAKKGRYPNAWTAIEYRDDAKKAWEDIEKLPVNIQTEFLSALNENPQCDVHAAAATILERLDKECRPFDTDEMNDAYEAAAQISQDAADEFRNVAELLGPTVKPDAILERVREKLDVSDQPVEEGMIGNRRYRILKNGIFLIKTHEGWLSFSDEEEARRNLSALMGESKIPKSK